MANENMAQALRTPSNNGNAFPRIPKTKLTDAGKRDVLIDRYVRGMYGVSENSKELLPPAQMAINVASRTASNVMDSESMMQMLPDMELAQQVLISSVLSPNDMMSTKLGYRTVNNDLGEVTPHLLKVVSNYFDNVYKINTQLPKMLKDILFTRGSYPIAVIPEAAIDDLINGNTRVAMESMDPYVDRTTGAPKGIGILGGPNPANTTPNPWDFGLESVSAPESIASEIVYALESADGNAAKTQGLGVFVTDNFEVLKFPKLHKRIVDDRIRDKYSSRAISLESDKASRKLTDREVDDLLSSSGRRMFSHSPVMSIKTLKELDSPTTGHPLVLLLPSEAVIPVHVPSSPEEHIGYFILVDQFGNPVRADLTKDYYKDLANNTNALKDMSSMLLAQAKRASGGDDDMMDMRLIEEMHMTFNQVVEKDVRSRLKNGVYGDNVEISNLDLVNRVMFARLCTRKTTQLVYIPLQLMVYMAFDYNAFGVGKSLLEATKILGSLRALLLFANVMASVKNSINHTDLSIELDPKDPDPGATVEYMLHAFSRTRQSSFPVACSNPQDLVHHLNNAGVQVHVSNHPGMPETKSTVENRQMNNVKPDTDLEETLKKRHLMATYVPPETVDLSMNVDFAKSVISSNLLLAKRAMLIQEKFTEFLGEFIRKFVFNSKYLSDKLRKILEEHKEKIEVLKSNKLSIDEVLLFFINSIEVFLPEPEISRMEVQKQTFDAYNEFIDVGIEAFMSSDQFDASVFGDLSNSVTLTKAALKAHLQREFMASNNILPELSKLFTSNENDEIGFDLFEAHSTYMEGVGKSMIPFMKSVLAVAKRNNDKLNKINEQNNAEPTPAAETTDEVTDTGNAAADAGLTEVDNDVGGTGDEGTDAPESPETPAEPTEETTEEKPEEPAKEGEEKPAEEDKEK